MSEDYQRKRCPFYGFHKSKKSLSDSKGNQCALITDSFTPCRFAVQELPVDWEQCPMLSEKTRVNLANTLEGRVYPGEFDPLDGKPWGISLSGWVKYINGLPKPDQPKVIQHSR